MPRLSEIDLTARIGQPEYEKRLRHAQRELLQLRLESGGHLAGSHVGPGMLIVFEGSDAGGKGGAIKRLVEPLDPRHYRVCAFAKPTFDEKSRHFLWRFWKEVPGLGGFTLFDRSWYGRVLVERVQGYATERQWEQAYDEIVQFERNLVLEGVRVVKFWLQVSPEEQLRRFEQRASDPLRQWKLTDEDWRNRDRIDSYNIAAEDMFQRTDHPLARWHLVSGEQKKWARVTVLETVVNELRHALHEYEQPDWGEDGFQ